MQLFIGFRLRFWAFAQFFYDVFSAEGKSFDDLKGSFRDNVLGTTLGGHLCDFPFSCLEDDHLAIGDPWSQPDEWYHDAIVESLERYVTLGREKGGMLPSYARAQIAHFGACSDCRAYGVEYARNDIVDMKRISLIVDDARKDPDFDRFVDDIVKRAREKKR